MPISESEMNSASAIASRMVGRWPQKLTLSISIVREDWVAIRVLVNVSAGPDTSRCRGDGEDSGKRMRLEGQYSNPEVG